MAGFRTFGNAAYVSLRFAHRVKINEEIDGYSFFYRMDKLLQCQNTEGTIIMTHWKLFLSIFIQDSGKK